MPYLAPTLNLSVDIWANGTPNTNPPDIPACPAQLYVVTRGDTPQPEGWPIGPENVPWLPIIYFRVPATTYHLNLLPLVGGYINYVDSQGDGWWYRIRFWEMAHSKFPNEYIEIAVVQCDVTGGSPDSAR